MRSYTSLDHIAAKGAATSNSVRNIHNSKNVKKNKINHI